MGTVNTAIVGIGNCASSLIQGAQFYSANSSTTGLTNPTCAGYSIADVAFTAAFDVDRSKIGADLAEAIWIAPNNALRFAEVKRTGVVVAEGILADGVGSALAERIETQGRRTVEEVAAELRRSQTHVVVNFLPTGSQVATEKYAQASLQAGCAFLNCIPSVIARSVDWTSKFERARLPLAGDDLKSQFGSTLIHHALMDALSRNGVSVSRTYQIVSGGNMDFLNLQDPQRLKSKKSSKVTGFGGTTLPSKSVHFGAEYMPFLNDRKVAFVRIEGEAFGGTTIDLDLRMSVEDSPSAAGNVFDAIRYLKGAMDKGLGGNIDPVAALLMKAPPIAMTDPDATAALRSMFDDVVAS